MSPPDYPIPCPPPVTGVRLERCRPEPALYELKAGGSLGERAYIVVAGDAKRVLIYDAVNEQPGEWHGGLDGLIRERESELVKLRATHALFTEESVTPAELESYETRVRLLADRIGRDVEDLFQVGEALRQAKRLTHEQTWAAVCDVFARGSYRSDGPKEADDITVAEYTSTLHERADASGTDRGDFVRTCDRFRAGNGYTRRQTLAFFRLEATGKR